MDSEIYNGYMNAVTVRGEEVTLNTHSDDYNGGIRHGGGYGAVYNKTATMLKNLEYVLGRALFDKCMQHYFNQWKFAHPYPEDFRNSIIQYSGVDLNWFFDQWIDSDCSFWKNDDIYFIKTSGTNGFEFFWKINK